MAAIFQRLIDRAQSIDWFSRVSLPGTSVETKLVNSYLCAVNKTECSVTFLKSPNQVTEHLKHRFDEEWMLKEDLASQRLRRLLSESVMKKQVENFSNDLIHQISDYVMRCADDRLGFKDKYLPKVGAGNAIEVCYLYALEQIVESDSGGSFGKKIAIFEQGRWPLCISNGKYLVY